MLPTHSVPGPLTIPVSESGLPVKEVVEVSLPQLAVTTIYDIVVVPPGDRAYTEPDEALTLAIAVLADLHVPPEVPLEVRADKAVTQIVVVPLMVPAFGSGFTVMVCVLVAGQPAVLVPVIV